MVQKPHRNSASMSSLENTERGLILALPPLSLAAKELGYFPDNQLNQKA